jgi:hypothetical protein
MLDLHTVARRLLALLIPALLAGCMNAEPTRWTLWYEPNSPKPGVELGKPCRTYVFATPGQSQFAVAVIEGWASPQPTGERAKMYSGEDFSGTMELGRRRIHDLSTGHDVDVNVIYRIRSYIPAKVRADADCDIAER